MRSTAGIFALAGALVFAAGTVALAGYPILDHARSFRGRITYTLSQTDIAHPVEVLGDLNVQSTSWSLEERAPYEVARAGSAGASVDGGGAHVGVDDPLAAGSIANAWAAAIGALATGTISATPNDGVWNAGRLRLYLDDTRDNVIGMADTAGAGDVTFSFDDWVDAGGLELPQRVTRLRDGTPEASFAISAYSVARAFPASPAPEAPAKRHQPVAVGSLGPSASQAPEDRTAIEFPWRLVLNAFGAMLLALVIVAWTRRDALIERVRRRVEDDPRGWAARGVSVFVSPEGKLHFDGADYRVGAQFYNRTATVQSSPLFLRVGSRDVPRAVVVARKFRPLVMRARRGGKALSGRAGSALGFTMIETLVAVALFAIVVVGAVFPTLVVMARGDAIAATQEDAVRIAANALGDEESACAYGAVTEGSISSQIGQLTLNVTVAPSASGVAGADDIAVTVSDPTGRVLARAISTVGPAVPPPPLPNATPTPPTSGGSPPPPTPAPTPTHWPG